MIVVLLLIASGNGNHAPTGSAPSTSDRFGNTNDATIFYGNERIDLPYAILANPILSISLWFKTSTQGGLIGHQTDFLPQASGQLVPILYIQPNGKLSARFWNGSVGNTNTNTTVLNDDTWHHVVITTSSSIQEVYIDGILSGQSSGMQFLPAMVRNQIGNVASNSNWTGTGGTGSFPFTGAIDDVRIYHLSLSQTDVTGLLNEGFSQPCTVTIPDANFKAYLIGNTTINTNGDTEIQCSEASSFTGIINCENYSISDLTGIESFTALTELNCSFNQLSNLNLSQNTSLTHLECDNNQLTSLDLSQNTALVNLICYYNNLSNINVTQ